MVGVRLALALVLVLTSIQVAFVPFAGAMRPGDNRPSDRPRLEQDGKQDNRARSDRAKSRASKRGKEDAKPDKERSAKKKSRIERRRESGNRTRARQRPARELETGVIRDAGRRGSRTAQAGTRYIVVFRSDRVDSQAAVADLRDEPGIIPTHVYEHVFSGFAAYLTPEAKRELEQDQRVASITEDRENFLAAQHLPAGTDRVDADENPVADIDGTDERVNTDIVIIDTGIQLNHPDLNVFAFANCTPSAHNQNQFDIHGHGTHVAGTAAALDNSIGTVGVAPGARLWAFRVMDASGFIFDSYIIACLDLVTHHAQTPFNGQTIDSVNISLGRLGTDGACAAHPYHQAICNAVNAGATIAVAAGNDSANAGAYFPATFAEVITVSALADKDGQPGGKAGNFQAICNAVQADDGLASFSNFGSDVDIAAPGVDIFSTYPTYFNPTCSNALGNGYDAFPGTSMASPHVAGAAGLIKATNPGFTPAQVKAQLLATRENVAMPGDPDGINEGILNVGVEDEPTKPTVTINAPNSAKVKKPVTIRVNATDPDGIDRVELHLCKPGCKKVATDRTAPYRFVRRHNQPGPVKYMVRAFDNEGDATDKFKTIKIKKAT